MGVIEVEPRHGRAFTWELSQRAKKVVAIGGWTKGFSLCWRKLTEEALEAVGAEKISVQKGWLWNSLRSLQISSVRGYNKRKLLVGPACRLSVGPAGVHLWIEKRESSMTDVERRFCKLLLLADMAAILISMVAGPLSHTSLAIGAAVQRHYPFAGGYRLRHLFLAQAEIESITEGKSGCGERPF